MRTYEPHVPRGKWRRFAEARTSMVEWVIGFRPGFDLVVCESKSSFPMFHVEHPASAPLVPVLNAIQKADALLAVLFGDMDHEAQVVIIATRGTTHTTVARAAGKTTPMRSKAAGKA